MSDPKEWFEDLVKRACTDPDAAGRLADHCRFNLGLTYQETYQVVRRRHPDLDEAEWDQLLAESES
jgi:hypothetical protein